MEITYAAAILIIVAAVVGAVSGAVVAYQHRYLFRIFNPDSHYVDVGPLRFRLNYIRSFRNPSGRMIFTWMDELGGIHEQKDPRVFAMETTGSVISRYLRGAPDLSSEDYTNAVKKHIGHGKGWCSVSNTEVMRDSVFRWIAFCVVHIQIKPAPRYEAVTD